MVFDGDTDNQDICTLADNRAGSNDISFRKTKKAMYANLASRQVWRTIWKAYGGWIADDSNNSGKPEIIVNLVTTLRNVYALAGMQYLDSMEWLDASGTWQKLTKITIEEIISKGISETEFMKTPGNPVYYRPEQAGVRIYPDSDTARASALKAHIRRDIVAFTSTSTAVSPGWDSIQHEGLAIGMALLYARDNTLSVAASLAQEWNDFLGDVALHWQQKFAQNFPAVMKKRRDAARQYI